MSYVVLTLENFNDRLLVLFKLVANSCDALDS